MSADITAVIERLDTISQRLEAIESVVVPSQYLTREQYAKVLGVSSRTVDRMIAEKRLDVERVRNQIRILRGTLPRPAAKA